MSAIIAPIKWEPVRNHEQLCIKLQLQSPHIGIIVRDPSWQKERKRCFSYTITICMSQINPILPSILIVIHVFAEATGHTERRKDRRAPYFTNESVAALHVST